MSSNREQEKRLREPKAFKRPEGLYFNDFVLGDTVFSGGRTITEADIVNFAGVSGDFYELHTNELYAQQTLFGERVAHGLLVLSMASGLLMDVGFVTGTVEAFTALEWRFRAPVKIGDTIRVEAKVSDLKPARRLGGGYVTLKVTVRNQRDESVQRGSWTVLVKAKSHA